MSSKNKECPDCKQIGVEGKKMHKKEEEKSLMDKE